jgi:hypothetical protein
MQNQKMEVNTFATFAGKYSYHSKCRKNNSITNNNSCVMAWWWLQLWAETSHQKTFISSFCVNDKCKTCNCEAYIWCTYMAICKIHTYNIKQGTTVSAILKCWTGCPNFAVCWTLRLLPCYTTNFDPTAAFPTYLYFIEYGARLFSDTKSYNDILLYNAYELNKMWANLI